MRSMRIAGGVVLAVLTMSSLAVSSAVARPAPQFVFHGGVLPPEEVSIKTPLGAAHTLFYYHGIANPIVECEVARGHGEILNVGEIGRVKSVELTYEECRVPGYELTCEVNGSKIHGSLKVTGVEGKLGYFEPGSSDVLLYMKPSSGVFTEVEFTGTCPLTGRYPIKKGVIGEIPASYINQFPGTTFGETLALNASNEQLFKEFEDNLTTTVDELKIGTTPVGLKSQLEFKVLGTDTVSIVT
jgi:hypothetical protein